MMGSSDDDERVQIKLYGGSERDQKEKKKLMRRRYVGLSSILIRLLSFSEDDGGSRI